MSEFKFLTEARGSKPHQFYTENNTDMLTHAASRAFQQVCEASTSESEELSGPESHLHYKFQGEAATASIKFCQGVADWDEATLEQKDFLLNVPYNVFEASFLYGARTAQNEKYGETRSGEAEKFLLCETIADAKDTVASILNLSSANDEIIDEYKGRTALALVFLANYGHTQGALYHKWLASSPV